MTQENLRLAIISGEQSGDALGASLVDALQEKNISVTVTGVGSDKLAARGQQSFFPQSDIAVMGVTAVVQRLPLLLRRINETANQLVAENPDIVVTIDSPDFNLRVARKLRARAPHIPIVHWVCPSVWAWRPKRAIRMRPHIDHILCLLPFEPYELEKLHGPRGTYVGHPLIERAGQFRPQMPDEASARSNSIAPLILVLPGSRHSIISRLMPVFRETVIAIHAQYPNAQFVIPTVPHACSAIESAVVSWPMPISIIDSENEKLAAFRKARAALAASGTVTLELALAGIPTVAAYRVPEWEAVIARRVIRVPSVILPNLILGEKAVPEFLQEDCTAEKLSAALLPLIGDTPARAAQSNAFAKLDQLMSLGDEHPSQRAAQTILDRLASNK